MLKINNRKELFEHLENIMTGTYENLKEEGEMEFEQNKLKTYIIEANIPIHDLQKLYGNKFNISVESTDDITLFKLTIADDNRKDRTAIFFIDTFNPRFWLCHTTSKSDITDLCVKKIVSSVMSHLDHLWLDKVFLEHIQEEDANYTKGIGIQYNYGKIFQSKEEGMEYFTMRAWGALSKDILNKIHEDAQLKHILAVSSVGFKRNIENNTFHETITEDLNYQGKFSVNGTSIQAHLDVVESVEKDYSAKLETIEEEYNIFYEEKEHGLGVHGSPLLISFRREIEDLNKFLETILSSKRPFRLSGFRYKLENNFYLVTGIDLHNGDKFEMEFSPNWARLYLPKGSCGNTALRLASNLQRYYDSETTLEGTENGRII